MIFEKPTPLKKLLSFFDHLEVVGDSNFLVKGVNEINKVNIGELTFVKVEKYYKKVFSSAASVILIDKKPETTPEDKILVVCKDPFEAYDQLVKALKPLDRCATDQRSQAKIGENTCIEPNVFIGKNVSIGDHCYIQANAYIGDDTVIGNHVTIQANTSIGTDAFYFENKESHYQKWHTIGRVVISDNVEIGAGTTIAKGVAGDTIIGQGTKIDTQVNIGHGVVIGENCLIAAQVGIAGKTIIGNNVIIYGQVGIAQRLTIEDRVVILAKSGVSKNLKAGGTYFGYPAADVSIKYKELATLRILSRRKKI